MPAAIFESKNLERIHLNANFFIGEIPCMAHEEPELTVIDLSRNYFHGDLKECLFTKAPKLTELRLEHNTLDSSPIPPSITQATELQVSAQRPR